MYQYERKGSTVKSLEQIENRFEHIYFYAKRYCKLRYRVNILSLIMAHLWSKIVENVKAKLMRLFQLVMLHHHTLISRNISPSGF